MLQETTPIATAALPLGALGAHLRLGTSFAEDALQTTALEGFLRAAIASIEGRIEKALFARRFTLRKSRWSQPNCQPLPIGPAKTIDRLSIQSHDGRGLDVPLTNIWLDTDGVTVRPIGAAMPHIPDAGYAVIEFQAGFGPNWEDIPADLRQAVLILAAHFYEYRDDAGLSQGCMPFGVSALLERYRPMRLGAIGVRS